MGLQVPPIWCPDNRSQHWLVVLGPWTTTNTIRNWFVIWTTGLNINTNTSNIPWGSTESWAPVALMADFRLLSTGVAASQTRSRYWERLRIFEINEILNQDMQWWVSQTSGADTTAEWGITAWPWSISSVQQDYLLKKMGEWDLPDPPSYCLTQYNRNLCAS